MAAGRTDEFQRPPQLPCPRRRWVLGVFGGDPSVERELWQRGGSTRLRFGVGTGPLRHHPDDAPQRIGRDVVAVGRHKFDRSASRLGSCGDGVASLIGRRAEFRFGAVDDLVHAVTVRPDVITNVIVNVTGMSPREKFVGRQGDVITNVITDVVTDITGPAQGRLFRATTPQRTPHVGETAVRTPRTAPMTRTLSRSATPWLSSHGDIVMRVAVTCGPAP